MKPRNLDQAGVKTLIIQNSSQLPTGCWEWIGSRDSKGYGKIKRVFNGLKFYLAHRLSWSAFRGAMPKGACVLHKCDNPCCVNPEHLRTGSKQDNYNDMVARGRDRKASGEAHGNAKFNKSDILKMRSLWETGERQTHIAAMFRCHKQTVWNVIHGRQRRHG